MYSFSRNNFSDQNTTQQTDAAQTADAGAWSVQTEGVAVHTGFPNPGIDARLHGLDLNSLLIKNSASTYMMRVSGNDWQHIGIFDGDIAVVDRALSAQANDIIIWWCDGDYAISARNRMRPEAVVWGVVTSVVHQYRYKVEQGGGN